MARLRVAATISAPLEDVYRFVTAYGPEGPVSEELFAEKNGDIIGHDGAAILTREDGPGGALDWSCTFEYPESRMMQAVDSNWSDREDRFRLTAGGTRWVVTFLTTRSGLLGFMQWVVFRVATSRRVRRVVVKPVVAHFHDGAGREE